MTLVEDLSRARSIKTSNRRIDSTGTPRGDFGDSEMQQQQQKYSGDICRPPLSPPNSPPSMSQMKQIVSTVPDNKDGGNPASAATSNSGKKYMSPEELSLRQEEESFYSAPANEAGDDNIWGLLSGVMGNVYEW